MATGGMKNAKIVFLSAGSLSIDLDIVSHVLQKLSMTKKRLI